MSWIQTLYETYDKNRSLAGNDDSEDSALLPIFHMTTKAHIEVILDNMGNFIDALPVDPSEKPIIIPCTESSSSRSGSKPLPHPLNDKIQYLASNYHLYGNKWNGYEDYLEMIEEWARYEKADNKIKAILEYIKKGSLIDDLLKSKIFELEDTAKLIWGEKVIYSIKVDPQDSVIRWSVEETGVLESRTWKDTNLFDNWISFYLSTKEEKGLCYVLGKEVPLESKHPKNIYSMCANAKIISSNDDKGFTFRGRNLEADQVYGLSYEVS